MNKKRRFKPGSPNSSFDTQQQKKIVFQLSKANLLYNHEDDFGIVTSRCSTKCYNVIQGYAANTNIGLIRVKNEDRVSVIVNI